MTSTSKTGFTVTTTWCVTEEDQMRVRPRTRTRDEGDPICGIRFAFALVIMAACAVWWIWRMQ